MRLGRDFLFTAILVAFIHTSTFGIVLAPGDTVAMSGTSAAIDPSLGGAIVAQTDVTVSALAEVGPNQFSGQLFTAELRSVVIRETSTGTLDFYYQILNGNNFYVDPISTASISSFERFDTAVNFRTDQGGIYAPTTATRDSTGAGIVFSGLSDASVTIFQPGQRTTSMIVRTNAMFYSPLGIATLKFTGTSNDEAPPIAAEATVSTYIPSNVQQSSVPEPQSILLFAAAILTLIFRVKIRYLYID